MKSIKKILPEKMELQIKEDVACIKTILKDDKEYADKTLEKLILLQKGNVHGNLIRDHLTEKYNSLEENMTNDSYKNFCLLQEKVIGLESLILLKKPLVEKELMYQYIKNNNFGIDNFKNYITEVKNEIVSEIESQYNMQTEILGSDSSIATTDNNL